MKVERKWAIISLIVFTFILSSLLLFSTPDATEKKIDNCDQVLKIQCPPKIEGQIPKCCPNPINACPLNTTK